MVDVETLILGAVLSAVLSGVISLLVTMKYGPRAVQRENVKRLHSENLGKTLATWEHGVSKYCHVGVGFTGLGSGDFPPSPNEGGGVILGRAGEVTMGYAVMDIRAREPIDPLLDYFEELWSHLGKGYPETVQLWRDLKLACSYANERIKGFLDEISKEILLDPSGRPHESFRHWDGHSNPPTIFILLEDITFLVWQRLMEKVTSKPRLQYKILEITGPKNVQAVVRSDEPISVEVYDLSWKNIDPHPLVRAYELKTCQAIKSKIEYISDSTINKGRVESLVSEMNEVEKHAEKLQKRLQEIRTEIELGKNLNGDCKVCQNLG